MAAARVPTTEAGELTSIGRNRTALPIDSSSRCAAGRFFEISNNNLSTSQQTLVAIAKPMPEAPSVIKTFPPEKSG